MSESDDRFPFPWRPPGDDPVDDPRGDPAYPGLSEPDAAELWPAEREAIYRLIYQIEARLNHHFEEAERERQVVRDGAAARHRDAADARQALADLRAGLTAAAVRLNLVTVGMVSVALFALAGPDGLRQIATAAEDAFAGRPGGLGLDGMVTLAGGVIPLLYPIGRKIFFTFKPQAGRAGAPPAVIPGGIDGDAEHGP